MGRYTVIGLGRFGKTLAELLAEDGQDVIAIDKDPVLVDEIKDKVGLAVVLDAMDEEALASQGVGKCDAVIVGIGEDFEANQLATVLAKKIGVKRVITRATSPIRAKILNLVGADEIIRPEEEAAHRLARRLTNPNVISHAELSENHSLIEIESPRKFHGKTIGEIDLRKKHGVNLVAIKRRISKEEGGKTKEEVNYVPTADDIIKPGDILVVVGRNNKLEELSGN
ncbi:MAG: TrkA family potassium uptake protein [Planctomycetota bacterium]